MECVYLLLMIVIIQETSELSPDILKYDEWIKDAETTVKKIKANEKRREEYQINKDTYIHDKRETNTGSSDLFSEQKHIYVDLRQIGYEGSWEDFCSAYKMDLDFPDDPKHELRACREMICKLRAENNITLSKIHIFVVYKFMTQVRPVIETLSTNLVNRFANKNEDLVHRLMDFPDVNREHENPECYKTVMDVFEKVCLDEKNPYHEVFRPFFTRICGTGQVSTRDMIGHIVEECKDKASLIEWNYDKILRTIHYQEI